MSRTLVRTVSFRASAAAIALLGAWAAYTQTPGTPTKTAPRPATTQKVKDGLYMISGEGGNVSRANCAKRSF